MRKQKLCKLLLFFGLATAGWFAMANNQASAAIPDRINFQGKVVNNGAGNVGTNVADTSYTFIFRIYSVSGPTTTGSCTLVNNCLWEETDTISTVNGVFQVELGANCSFVSAAACNNSTPIDFTGNSLYLTMKFNSDAAGFMSPTIHFTSVPYAFNADKLGGLDKTGFIQNTATCCQSANIAIQTASSGSIVAVFRGASGQSVDLLEVQTNTPTTVFAIGSGGAVTVSPTGNNIGTIIKQTSGTATSGSVLDVQTVNGTSHFIQIANSAANEGAVTIQSVGATRDLTLDSGSATIKIGSTATSLQKAASAFTLDLSNVASNSTLTISNTGGAGNIILNLDSGGNFAIGGSNGTSIGACTSSQYVSSYQSVGGIVTAGSCSAVSGQTTLQNAYDNGANATVNLTDARDITFNLADTATDPNFIINLQCATSCGTNGRFAIQSAGVDVLKISPNGGAALFQNSANSATAFEIANASGAMVFNVSTLDTNLITVNPGFEVNPLNGWAVKGNGTPTRDTTQSYVGFASGTITITSGVANSGASNSNVTLTNGTQYTLSFYAKVAAGTSFTTLAAGWLQSGDQLCTLNSNTVPSSGWSRFYCTFTPGASATAIFIGASDTAAHTFNIDAVQLEAASFASPYGAAQIALNANIISPVNFQAGNSTSAFQITNSAGLNIANVDTASYNTNNLVRVPSFETSPLTGWTARTACTLTQDNTQFLNGPNSAKCVNTATTLAGFNLDTTTTGLTSALVNATSYTLSFYARSSALMTTLEIGRRDNGSGSDIQMLTAQTVTSSGWSRFSVSFTAGAQSNSPFIYIRQSDATARSIWIDAVLLETDANSSTNYRDAKISLGGVITSQMLFQMASNSSTAFQVQNASGTQIFNIDTTDTNLVDNPGFEANATNWAVKGSATGLVRDTTKTYLGVASGKVVTTSTAGDGMRYTFPTQLPSATYTISAYVQVSAADSTFNLGYNNGSDTNCASITPAASATVPSTTGWTRFVCTTATSAVLNSIYITSGTTALANGLWVDAVQVESGALATAYGAGAFSFNGIFNSPLNIRSVSNSTTAFTLQDTSSNTLLAVDTLNDIVNIASTGAQALASTINIGTTTANNTQVVNIGSLSSASNAVLIQGGTGATAIQLITGTSGTISIGTNNNSATITIGNTALSTGTQAINIGNTNTSGGTTNITIGTGSSATGGTTTVQAVGILTLKGATSSSTAIQIQTAGGTNLMVFDTSANKIIIGVSDTTGTIVIFDTKTGSGDPTGTNGAIYYSSGGQGGAGSNVANYSGKFRCFEGNLWKNCIGMRDVAERRWGYAAPSGTTATTFTTSGNMNLGTVGATASSSNQAESNYVNYATSTTSGNAAGVNAGTPAFTTLQTRWLPKLVARVRSDGTAVTTTRYWISYNSAALTATAPPTASTGSAIHYIALAYDAAVNSGKWLCASGDGSNMSGTDTGVTVTAAHYYDIILDLSTAGTLVCSVADNGAAYTTVTKTTNLPGTSTSLGLSLTVTTNASSARNLAISYFFHDFQ